MILQVRLQRGTEDPRCGLAINGRGTQKHPDRTSRSVGHFGVPRGAPHATGLLLSALGYPEKVPICQFLSLRQKFKPKEIHWLLELALWRRTSRVRHLSPRAVEYPTLGICSRRDKNPCAVCEARSRIALLVFVLRRLCRSKYSAQ